MILRIDDHDARGMKVTEIVELLRGEKGTTVTLVVRAGADESRTITVTRGPVVLATLEGIEPVSRTGWDHRLASDPRIRYVKIRQVNGSTVHDLRKLERQFQKDEAQAVILDFRSTFAGELHHALLLADALLDGGEIGRLRTRIGVQEFRADRDCLFRDRPVAVLVDRHTHGGGEWIAAALQDNRAALVIGEPTAGNWEITSHVRLQGSEDVLTIWTGLFERAGTVPGRKDRDAVAADNDDARARGMFVIPEHRIPNHDRAFPETIPFSVLRPRSVPVVAPVATDTADEILELAAHVLKPRISVAQRPE